MKLTYIWFVLFLIVLVPQTMSFAQIEWTQHIIEPNLTWSNCAKPGDIDNDGDLDVLATGQSYIIWLENDGNLGFARHNIFSAGVNLRVCMLADIDGDGFLDAAVVDNFGDNVAWFHNDGTPADGEWQRFEVISGYDAASLIEAVDLNGDGFIDLVANCNGTPDDCSVWYNDGTPLNGGWSRQVLTTTEISGLDVGDLDGDGDIDVLYAQRLSHIGWYENTGSGGVNHQIPNTVGYTDLFGVDVNGDGCMDIVACNSDAGNIDWLESDGTYSDNNWTIHGVATGFTSPGGLSCVDVDGDADVDIIVTDWFYVDRLDWYENDGTPGNGLWLQHILCEGNGPARPYGEDMDLDGDTDILCPAGTPADVLLFEQIGTSQPPEMIDITLTADVPLQLVPGGNFTYGVLLESNLPSIQYIDVWTMVILPNNNTFGPLWHIMNIPMGPGFYFESGNIYQEVPIFAPIGSYSFVMKAGMCDWFAAGEDEFAFEVVPLNNTQLRSPATSWRSVGHDVGLTGVTTTEADEGLPTQFGISDAWPNPFNPSTSFSVMLPESSKLTVAVYNITGQQVTTLADGQFNAGQHTFSFDADDLASGLYFIRAIVPGQMDELRKVTLIR